MKQPLIFVLSLVTAALSSSCASDAELARVPTAGAGGSAGAGSDNGGAGGAAGGGAGGAAGAGGSGGGSAGSSSNAGAAGSTAGPAPALPPNAPTVACPTVIQGALEPSDPTQRGRHSRILAASTCGASKSYPGDAADPSGPHLFDVYRFRNPGASAACFTFTLSYGESDPEEVDAGAADDAGALDGGADAAEPSPEPSAPAPGKYMIAHSTFYPTDLAREHRGDVGDTLLPPQTMGITVGAGDTIDVVVYAIDTAPAGAGPYTLSCAVQ